MSVWSVRGDEVWYSGWRAENYLSCITVLVGPQDLEVKTLFNVQFFSRWSIDSCWTWRSLSLLSPYSTFSLTRHSASISERRLWLTLTTLDHSQPKVLTNSHGPWRHSPSPLPLCLSHQAHISPISLNPYLLLPGPAWVINYLMESIQR